MTQYCDFCYPLPGVMLCDCFKQMKTVFKFPSSAVICKCIIIISEQISLLFKKSLNYIPTYFQHTEILVSVCDILQISFHQTDTTVNTGFSASNQNLGGMWIYCGKKIYFKVLCDRNRFENNKFLTITRSIE